MSIAPIENQTSTQLPLACLRRHWVLVREIGSALFVLCSTAMTSHAQRLPAWQLVEEQQWSGDTNLFTGITAILPTSGGSILVVEPREGRLRVFGANGGFERTIGRDGQGPGEFVRLNAAGLFGDTLWTTDLNLRRTTLFRTSGDLVSTMPWNTVAASESSNLVSGVFADGTAWGEKATTAAALAGPELPKAVLRLTRTARSMDTLALVSTEHTLFNVMDGPAMNFGPQPFSDAPLVVASSTDSRLFVIVRPVAPNGKGGLLRVVAVNARGDTAWSREFLYSPRPLERRVADSVLDRTHRGMRRSGVTIDVVRRVLFLPTNRPPVSAAIVAHDGTLWPRREAGQATVEYWVVSADGILIGSVPVAANVSIAAANGEHAWGIRSDTDGVPSIVRFRISR